MESVLIDSLALVFGTPRSDWEPPTETLDALPDAQLWALVYRGMAWPDGVRLQELTAGGKQAALSDEEQAELEVLIDEADRLTLLRSRALLALRQRGYRYNSQGLLQPGP